MYSAMLFFVLVGLHYYQTFLGVISLKTKDRWMEWCYICKYKEHEINLKKRMPYFAWLNY